MGCSPWGHKELDTTEQLIHTCLGKMQQNNLEISFTNKRIQGYIFWEWSDLFAKIPDHLLILVDIS